MKNEPLGELLKEPITRESWARGCAVVLDWILPQRKLLVLMQNNHHVLHTIGFNPHDDEDHIAMHKRADAILSFLSADKLPLVDRLRMAGCIGLVMGILAFPGVDPFANVPTEELQALLVDAINDLLQVD